MPRNDQSRLDLHRLAAMHEMCVRRWHLRPIDNPYDHLLAVACEQFAFNFRLWHEEDKARCPVATDDEIAQLKRAIDRLNQARSDAIERLDDWIATDLARRGIAAPDDAPLNTETLGSTIDRLGILALRIFHLREQLERADATDEHREQVGQKLYRATLQHDDLTRAAQQLADDLHAGRKRHQTCRQLKMYNDPTLNPYLYRASEKAALAPRLDGAY